MRVRNSGDEDQDALRLPTTGSLIRRRALGTEAVYRVVGQNDRGVEVETVMAPGLAPGARFTLAIEDVIAMRDPDDLSSSAQPVRRRVASHRYA